MSNTCSLCCSDFPKLYPSERYAGYNPHEDEIAFEANVVPLLWLALFRPNDLRRQVVPNDGDPFRVEAPVAEKAKALAQLEGAVPLVNGLLAPHGPIDEHARLLAQALREARGGYVTIETIEIMEIHGEDRYYPMVRRALRFFEKPAPELKKLNAAPSPPTAHRATGSERMAILKSLRERTRAGMADLVAALERFEGDTAKVIAHFDSLKSRIDYIRDVEKRRPPEPVTIRDVFTQITGYRWHAPIPARAEFQRSHEMSVDQHWNYSRLLGSSSFRPVPWE